MQRAIVASLSCARPVVFDGAPWPASASASILSREQRETVRTQVRALGGRRRRSPLEQIEHCLSSPAVRPLRAARSSSELNYLPQTTSDTRNCEL